MGIFGSWLWVAHGAYVAQLYRPSRQGYGFGLFNSLFSANGILGFGILLALSSAALDASMILWILFGISLLGTISAFFVKNGVKMNLTKWMTSKITFRVRRV